MALVPCLDPECGKKVSSLATTCPHCGCPLSAPTGASAPQSAPDSEFDQQLEVTIKICSYGATLVGGELSLNSNSVSHIPAIVTETASAISSGIVTSLQLSGHTWEDGHVEELVGLLLPGYSSFGAFLRSANTAKQSASRLGNLTTLRVLGCAQLTDKAMGELSKLSTLKRVSLTGWDVKTDDAMMMLQFVRLPDLEVLDIPFRIRSHEFFPGGTGWYKGLKDRFRPTVDIR